MIVPITQFPDFSTNEELFQKLKQRYMIWSNAVREGKDIEHDKGIFPVCEALNQFINIVPVYSCQGHESNVYVMCAVKDVNGFIDLMSIYRKVTSNYIRSEIEIQRSGIPFDIKNSRSRTYYSFVIRYWFGTENNRTAFINRFLLAIKQHSIP